MKLTGNASFSIYGKSLDFELIKEILPISPSKIIRRGEWIGLGNNIRASYDSWIYDIPAKNNVDLVGALTELLDILMPCSQAIKRIKSIYEDTSIQCYLRSDYGQIGFSLNEEILQKAAQLEIQVDFHILSFGMIENMD